MHHSPDDIMAFITLLSKYLLVMRFKLTIMLAFSKTAQFFGSKFSRPGNLKTQQTICN